ncbi:MAG: SGNH/GDSL hydrolase family protein [Lachnospiraceae bacterium]|nr:SGNH/GDSL hydrolase family protein [Lachnospiraceae bacterium]
MEKVNKVLLLMIAMASIMLAAVGIDRGMQAYDAWKWESERLVRYEQAYAEVADMQVTISQLSQDQEAITAFIEENKSYFETETGVGEGWGTSQEEVLTEQDLPEEWGEELEVSGDGFSENMDVTGNGLPENTDITGNELLEELDVTGNELLGSWDVTGNEVSGNSSVSSNDLDGYTDISGNWTENGGGISGNTLTERQRIRSSYMETQMQNKIDLEVLAENSADFSDISITCLGDSITEAANLSNMEDYQQYSYPSRLKELLNAESMTNLGIGGSSIGRYWENAFVDRYKEIPEDTDLILVMGGTNDGFCMSDKDIGTMEERKAGTFIGDLDELMRGLRENYPEAEIVFVTPLPNVLHDMLKKERDYLLPQSVLVNIIIQLATEYDIPVIDLYNSNILDTHDAAVIYNYMPDGVHCNPKGYSVLAEHLAAELVRMYGGDVPKEQE